MEFASMTDMQVVGSSMQSKIIALLAPEGSLEATLVVRRANGQFALARIDARVAHAPRVAASYRGTNQHRSPSP
jgi:hypothetical protein